MLKKQGSVSHQQHARTLSQKLERTHLTEQASKTNCIKLALQNEEGVDALRCMLLHISDL